MASLISMRLFAAACEERSFTVAAAREHATQPGVSQHIRKLEVELGVALFQRSRTAVVPTPAGDVFYAHCIEVLRAHDRATRSAREHAGGLDGQIAVGLMPTMTRAALAPALARFCEANPNVAVFVDEAYSAALTTRVRAGEFDFAIVPRASAGLGVRMSRFVRTQEMLVSRADPAAARSGPVRPRDLQALKLVIPSSRNARRERIEAYLAENGVSVARRLEMDSMFGTLDLVAGTDWCAVLPGLLVANDLGNPRYSICPLVKPGLMLDLVLIEPARRTMNPAAKAFAGELAAQATHLNAKLRSELRS